MHRLRCSGIFYFFSETDEGNLMKLERNQDLNILYQVCVFRVNKKKTDGRNGLWLADTFLTSPNPLNGIQQNLTGSKISMSFTKFVFFGPIPKTRWPPQPLISWDIFYLSSETAERNSRKLDKKQDLHVLYQVCVFRAQEPKAPVTYCDHALSGVRPSVVRRPLNYLHFRLLLQNRLMDFDETWYGWSTQYPLQVLLFFGQIRPGADPGRGKNRSRGVPFFRKLLLQTGRLQQQTECIAVI